MEITTAMVEAYLLGERARGAGAQLGTNPFNPESEPRRYEAWIDGWADDNDDWDDFFANAWDV